MTTLPTLPWDHAGSIGVLVCLVYIAVGRVRMQALIADQALTPAEANRFCIAATVAVAVFAGLYATIAFVAGIPERCLLPFTHPRLWPLHGLLLASIALLLYWLWLRGGDGLLARVAPAFTHGAARDASYTPRQVRLWITAMMVVGYGGIAALRLTTTIPSPSGMKLCPQSGSESLIAPEPKG